VDWNGINYWTGVISFNCILQHIIMFRTLSITLSLGHLPACFHQCEHPKPIQCCIGYGISDTLFLTLKICFLYVPVHVILRILQRIFMTVLLKCLDLDV